MRGLVITLAGVLAVGPALAQPPEAEAPPPPDKVCLTNACSEAPKPIAEPKTVRDAIAAGQAYKVRDLGGTPAQAMEAIFERLKGRENPTAEERRSTGGYDSPFHLFADTSDGSTLSFSDALGGFAPRSMNAVGSIVRRYPDGRFQQLNLLDTGGAMVAFDLPNPQ